MTASPPAASVNVTIGNNVTAGNNVTNGKNATGNNARRDFYDRIGGLSMAPLWESLHQLVHTPPLSHSVDISCLIEAVSNSALLSRRVDCTVHRSPFARRVPPTWRAGGASNKRTNRIELYIFLHYVCLFTKPPKSNQTCGT